MNLLNKAGEWLRNNHITVPDDWLQACVEWIREENQGSVLTETVVSSQVYEQWLLADLHELETGCLPPEIVTEKKFQLSGTFALQIDSIVDVGVSFYSQSQKLQGKENANVHVTADEPTQKPWEQKPSRMLMMKLTDGLHTVQGMEYRPIACLSPQVPPGSKILVHGTVLCRHGILMLSEDNVKFLGGEVDTLAEANSMINTLQSAMEASTENANKEHKQSFPGTAVNRKKSAHTPNTQTYTQPHQGLRNKIGARSYHGNSSQFKPKIEVKSQLSQGNFCQAQTARTNQNLEDLDALMDDFDDDFVEEIDASLNTPVDRNQNNKPVLSCTKQNFGESRFQHVQQPSVTAVSVNIGATDDIDAMDFDDDDYFAAMEADLEMSNKPTKNQPKINKQMPISDQNHFAPDGNIRNIGTGNRVKVKSDVSVTKDTCQNLLGVSNSVTGTYRNKTQSEGNGQSSVAVSTPSTGDLGLGTVKVESVSENDMVPVNTGKRSHSSESEAITKLLKLKKEQNDFLRNSSNTEIQTEYPFTYLSSVLKQPHTGPPVYHTVKAYIVTLTSKLSSENDKWRLSCKINDGTSAVDVDLSSQVLNELVGFSAAEANNMRHRIKQDPKVKDILKKGMAQCQQTLIELMCLLELEISSTHPRPVVVATKELTSHHGHLLYNRVVARETNV